MTAPVVEAAQQPGRQPSSQPGPEPDPVGQLFASRSLGVHLVRGVLGAVLVVGGLALSAGTAWALLAVPVGVVAWRGCPTCWTLGLVATLARTRSQCVDGSCAGRSR